MENEDLSKSEDLTDMSAFESKPLKKAKVVVKKKMTIMTPKEEKKAEKVASVASSVSTNDTKKLINKAKKLLKADKVEGKQEDLTRAGDAHCAYGAQYSRKSMQRAHKEHTKSTQRAHKEHTKNTQRTQRECEIQRERCHQDFMVVIMMAMTGAKSPASSPFMPLNIVTPTKTATTGSITTAMTVLHDTVMHMQTPPSPESTMSKSEKAQINKI
eukprot:11453726-Ditylum_brightwellii.AAC.1